MKATKSLSFRSGKRNSYTTWKWTENSKSNFHSLAMTSLSQFSQWERSKRPPAPSRATVVEEKVWRLESGVSHGHHGNTHTHTHARTHTRTHNHTLRHSHRRICSPRASVHSRAASTLGLRIWLARCGSVVYFSFPTCPWRRPSAGDFAALQIWAPNVESQHRYDACHPSWRICCADCTSTSH